MTTLETIFMGATAAFTGVSAFVAWRQHSGRLDIDVFAEPFIRTGTASPIALKFSIRNSTQRVWRVHTAAVSGLPNAELAPADNVEKHHSWPKDRCPMNLSDIAQKTDQRVTLMLSADWEALSKRVSKRWPRWRRSRSLCIIKLYANPRSSIRRPRRHIRIVAIPAYAITHNAAALTSARETAAEAIKSSTS